jgi:hypothetical protein
MAVSLGDGSTLASRSLRKIPRTLFCIQIAVAALLIACGGSDDRGTSAGGPSPTPSPTAAPRDPVAAEATFHRFVQAVQAGDIDEAWSLYAASVPGDTSLHRSDRGCDFGVFTFEFPNMQHLFSRTAPFQVIQWYGSSLGTTVVELSVRGADGTEFLATLARALDHEPYQLMYLNNGRPALIPGVPDPFPSPDDPRGFCGIWAGPR